MNGGIDKIEVTKMRVNGYINFGLLNLKMINSEFC